MTKEEQKEIEEYIDKRIKSLFPELTKRIQVTKIDQDGFFASSPPGFRTLITTTEIVPTQKFPLIKEAIEKILNNE